jgi:hypothetical protein
MAMNELPHRRLGPSHGCGGLGLAIALILLTVTPSAADETYGYIRTVEGDADLISVDSQPAIEASANYPVQVGDRIRVSPGGRLEVQIPDGSLLRFAENSELRFGRLAESFQSDEDRNHLQLHQGRLQIDLLKDPLDHRSFRIDTANTSLFLLSSGSYRLFTDGKNWTEVTVRRGYAEVVTDTTEYFVVAGQQALIDGGSSPRVTTQAAPPLDELERWGQHLEAEAETVEAQIPYRRGYVSETLGYAAVPLNRHGTWTRYRGSTVWRPRVPRGWRPYHSGWWIYTPAGMTWISTEPWGWVTYHYGSWGYTGIDGWAWHPGSRYTPGAVYWYWGPSHVGWIPTGYYPPYLNSGYCGMPPYGHFGGMRGPSHYPVATPYSAPLARQAGSDWTFSPYEKLGYRDSHRFLKTGRELQNEGVWAAEVPRGIITTDTRGLTPNLWSDPGRIRNTLERPRAAVSRPTRHTPRDETIGITSSAPRTQTEPHRGELSRFGRQWDSDAWRQQRMSPLEPVSPYRRDTRRSSSYLQSGHGSPLTRRRTPGTVSGSRTPIYYRRGDNHLPRSPLAGIAGRSSPLPRSSTATPRGHGLQGPDRSRSRASGRLSGSSGTGRPSGSTPRSGASSSGKRGSG